MFPLEPLALTLLPSTPRLPSREVFLQNLRKLLPLGLALLEGRGALLPSVLLLPSDQHLLNVLLQQESSPEDNSCQPPASSCCPATSTCSTSCSSKRAAQKTTAASLQLPAPAPAAAAAVPASAA